MNKPTQGIVLGALLVAIAWLLLTQSATAFDQLTMSITMALSIIGLATAAVGAVSGTSTIIMAKDDAVSLADIQSSAVILVAGSILVLASRLA